MLKHPCSRHYVTIRFKTVSHIYRRAVPSGTLKGPIHKSAVRHGSSVDM
jgi:hypothetical protein